MVQGSNGPVHILSYTGETWVKKIPEDLPYVGSKSSEGLSQIMVCVGNIVIVTQRALPVVFVLDATVIIIIMHVMIDILSLKDFTLILRFVISCC